MQNYVAGKNPQTGEIDQRIYKDVYFVRNPEAKGFAELLVAVYQKTLEGNIGGLGNSTLQAVDLMERYGKDDLFIGSHSRGTLTMTNALSALNTKENRDKKLLSGTDMKMVGPAADIENADNKLNQLQGLGEKRTSSERSIRVENHEADLVGNWWIVGNNPDSGLDTNVHNKGRVRTILDIFSDTSTSSHNCYGLGQPQCITDGYRDKGDQLMHPEKTVYELINPKK